MAILVSFSGRPKWSRAPLELDSRHRLLKRRLLGGLSCIMGESFLYLSSIILVAIAWLTGLRAASLSEPFLARASREGVSCDWSDCIPSLKLDTNLLSVFSIVVYGTGPDRTVKFCPVRS